VFSSRNIQLISDGKAVLVTEKTMTKPQ